jgi:Ni,Fe-hydrogenase III small subunit
MWRIIGDALKQGVVTGKAGASLPPELAPAQREPEAAHEALGQALRAEIQRVFRRSFKLRHVDCGSCNGCESELQALLNPFYDLQRFGIDFVASPRHADALIVTGPPTRHLVEALRLTDEATPRPRMIVAIGDCACHGGFCAGSFATLEGVHEVVPVDLRIPGCPPRPAAIIRGLLSALGRSAPGAMVSGSARV